MAKTRIPIPYEERLKIYNINSPEYLPLRDISKDKRKKRPVILSFPDGELIYSEENSLETKIDYEFKI